MSGEADRVKCQRCGGTGVEPDQVAIGARMRQKRRAAGMTLRDVAERVGKSLPYLSDLERGRRAWNAGITRDFLSAVEGAN
jgi:transcriptional regulator with XRE-family HTH domain